MFVYVRVPDHTGVALAALFSGTDRVEPDHMTVVHVPKEHAVPDVHVVNSAVDAMRRVARSFASFDLRVTGLAFFDDATKDGERMTAVVALMSAPGLNVLRQQMADALTDNGVSCSDDFSYVPHVTIGWLPRGKRAELGVPDGLSWTVERLWADTPTGPVELPLTGTVATEAVRVAGHFEDRARTRLGLGPAELRAAKKYVASAPLPPVDLYMPVGNGYLVASPGDKGHVLTTALGPGMTPRGVPAMDLLGPLPRQLQLGTVARPKRRSNARGKHAQSDEDAPGIPSRAASHELPELTESTRWQFAVQAHDAERRGPHLDVRLGDPATGHAHSWAMPNKWPAPGQSSWAIQQPTHTVKYMDFEGLIPSGYGKGAVRLRDRDQAEIVSSRPGHVSFNVYRGSGPEEYTLHRVDGRKWKLYNRTITRDVLDGLPAARPAYKDMHPDAVDVDRADEVMSAKIDDAHNLFVLPRDGQVRVVSYRPTDRAAGVIEHTHKVTSLFGTRTPAGLGGTILRGGLYATDPRTGRAVPSSILAGLLNANVWRSRAAQSEKGELKPIVYDVVSYKGEPYADKPYADKLRVLREVTGRLPSMQLPPMADTPDEKRRLLGAVRAGELGETREGVVLWNKDRSLPPTKVKFRDDHDVYVRDFFPGEGKYSGRAVGGFTYAHDQDGPVVGRCGTGVSDAMRMDMHEHPERYRGMVATVAAHEKFPSGALRVPSFSSWHLDKNPQDRLDAVIHA